MLKNFEAQLDQLFEQHGVGREKTAEVDHMPPPSQLGQLQPTRDVYRPAMAEPRMKSQVQSTTPIGAFQSGSFGNPPFPDAEGLAAQSPTWVSRAFGGMKEAAVAVHEMAREQACRELGLKTADQRFQVFGSSDKVNASRIMGMGLAALRQKYAGVAPMELKPLLEKDSTARLILDLSVKEKQAQAVPSMGSTSAHVLGKAWDLLAGGGAWLGGNWKTRALPLALAAGLVGKGSELLNPRLNAMQAVSGAPVYRGVDPYFEARKFPGVGW